MEFNFDTTLKNRMLLLQFLDALSLDQLNKVPKGFNNNIFWNIKHVVVTQQMLIYGLSNLPLLVSSEDVQLYRKGTKAEADVSEEEVEKLKKELFTTLEQTKLDYKAGLFKTYTEYTVTTKSTLTCVEDAISFNNFHEGIHLGYVLALKRVI